MAQRAWRAEDFLGLTPAIDPRRSDKFFALNGTNYLWDAIGPKSAFGNRFLTPYPLGLSSYTQGFRLHLRSGDRCFTMVGDSILEWNELVGGWTILYVTPNTTLTPYRWTFGYLNGYVYFCHPRTGILVMDVDSDVILPLDSPGMPIGPIALVVSNGRVCVITEDFMTWSAPSNGLDWTPRLGGPGQQRISDRVSGTPIMITSFTKGLLTWTSGGVMVSDFTGDNVVFRHRPLNTEYRPINSFCTLKIDDNTVVILDRRGLFQSKGEAPAAFAPVFNEFLLDYIQDYRLHEGQNIRIEWDDLRRQVYLSVSLSEENPIYESTFVYYPPVDKWGQFSEPHYGILPLKIDSGERMDDYFGFVDATGRVRYWQKIGSREILPASGTVDSVYPLIQKPAHVLENIDGIVLSSSAVANTRPNEGLTPSGYFPRDGSIAEPASLTGLAAKIQLGLLRFEQEQALDMMTEVNQLMIGSIVSGPADKVAVDYNLIPQGVSDVDYNIAIGDENFGVNELNYTNHQIRIVSTVDGVSEYQSSIPKLVEFKKGARLFSCLSVGIWHILELEAVDVGEAFALRTFELTASGAGRYT